MFEAFWSDDPHKALMHGPTYMGNALACAAANASLDLFEREPRLEQVTAIVGADGARACAVPRLCRASRMCGSRARSAWSSWSGSPNSHALRARFVEEGVFIRPFGNIIYLTPTFTIESQELSRLTGAIVKVVGEGTQGGR